MMEFNVKYIFSLVDRFNNDPGLIRRLDPRPWWKRWPDWLWFRALILWLDLRDYCARLFKR